MISTPPLSKTLENTLRYESPIPALPRPWRGSLDSVVWQEEKIHALLQQIDRPVHIVRQQGRIGVSQSEPVIANNAAHTADWLLTAPAIALDHLGNPTFCEAHSAQYAYMAGAMAGGIASEEMIIALGKANMLGSFGSGGLPLERIEGAIATIQTALPNGPYCFNLLHNPNDSALERATADLYLKRRVSTVEASAFLTLTPSIVYYRVAGLSRSATGQISANNKVIAKVSRQEIASQFMRPAPAKIIQALLTEGVITPQQAQLAEHVPMADDITIEADSGGHTDNRPLVCMLPAMIAIRDRLQAQYGYPIPVRIGSAGGMATPQSLLSAFTMGADYVVTGSINQSCVEAATSDHVKQLLAEAEMADVIMAPAADMFEMGVNLQVLKKGTLFPMRAKKLYTLYKSYDAIEQIPASEKEKVEKQIFRQTLEETWQGTVSYLSQRDPDKLSRAQSNPKLKMALTFRWYLGLSSRWSCAAEPDRKMDYQIWCGPAMGAFNEWTKNTYLSVAEHRQVVDIAHHLMLGAAIAYRMNNLQMQGLRLPARYGQYRPTSPLPLR